MSAPFWHLQSLQSSVALSPYYLGWLAGVGGVEGVRRPRVQIKGMMGIARYFIGVRLSWIATTTWLGCIGVIWLASLKNRFLRWLKNEIREH